MSIEKGCQADWNDTDEERIDIIGTNGNDGLHYDQGWIDRDNRLAIPQEALGELVDVKFRDGTEYINIHSKDMNWTARQYPHEIMKWRKTRSPLLCEQVKAQDLHELNKPMIYNEDAMADDLKNAKPGEVIMVDNLQDFVKQERYLDESGKKDWIDECAETMTPEEFRGAMKFTIGKYERRLGKKDSLSSELYKISDYYRRWSEYEKGLEWVK